MTKHKITIAAACMQVEHDKSANKNKIIEFIKEAAEEDVRLLVFPECCLQGFLWTWNLKEYIYREDAKQKRYFYEEAETIPGPFTGTIMKYASRYNMLIQVGMAERVEKGRKSILFNSVAIVGPKGVIGVFRKLHSHEERIIFQGGKELSVFKTFVGKIGPIICKDLIFPESVRVLALKGAEIITFSAAWDMNPRTDFSGYRYDLLGRVNAFMNGVWMVMSDQVGVSKRSEERCFGHSRIIDPKGNIVAGIGYEERLVTAKVDIKAGIDPNRLMDRCPKSYKTISSDI